MGGALIMYLRRVVWTTSRIKGTERLGEMAEERSWGRTLSRKHKKGTGYPSSALTPLNFITKFLPLETPNQLQQSLYCQLLGLSAMVSANKRSGFRRPHTHVSESLVNFCFLLSCI